MTYLPHLWASATPPKSDWAPSCDIEGGLLGTFDASGARLKTGGRIVLTSHDEIPASQALVALAFKRASKGEKPPLAHILLRDARAAFARHAYRRVLIDAAVAVEVTLAEWADRNGLKVKSPTLRNFIRQLHRHGALSEQGRELLQRDLVNPRNHAAHKAPLTSSPEALKALAAANAVVAKLAPLDLV